MKDFSEIYIENYPRLLRFAEDFIPCKEDAENVLHDAFLELWKANDRLDTIKNMPQYILCLVRNRCMDYLRHQIHVKRYLSETRYEMKAALDALVYMEHDMLGWKELNTVIRQAIDDLPPRCREIFYLSRVDKMRYKEIAEHLGISENTVSVQIGIALKRIRKVLDEYNMN